MKMKVAIGVLFAVLFAISCYVGVVRGEVAEETAVDNGMLTVRTIEKTVIKKEQYAMPSVEVSSVSMEKSETDTSWLEAIVIGVLVLVVCLGLLSFRGCCSRYKNGRAWPNYD